MRSDDIFNGINEIDEDLIHEAENITVSSEAAVIEISSLFYLAGFFK